MTEPIKPPTESGWYVIQVKGYKQIATDVFVDRDDATFYLSGQLMRWEPNGNASIFNKVADQFVSHSKVTRYTGPIDLEKLLDEGGER